ncbi:MAG: spermidine synthase [Desulfurococcaceae archaeon]|nr:spermidine synthase [Desulfurococcaceae archaeon]MCC6058606.1 spermidine synthase [Desulfurococcaceae archaeon]
MELGLMVIQGIGRGSSMVIKVRKVHVVRRSRYQEIVVADVEDFGRCLVLDGYIQSSEVDEHIYHESLVHPAMVLHPNPSKVLIIGGGEGATLREVLKHNIVRKAVMVDIDEDVVKVSREYLQSFHQNSFNDPRASVVIADGFKYISEVNEVFDIIILDLTDPYSSDIASALYTESFYRMVYSKLSDDGVMVTQAGSAFFYRDVYDRVVQAVKNVYPYYLEYQVWIPSFGYACNFVLGSKKYNPYEYLKSSYVDKVLRERGVSTKFINGVRLEALINLGVY